MGTRIETGSPGRRLFHDDSMEVVRSDQVLGVSQAEPSEFPEGLDVGWEKKRRAKVSGLSTREGCSLPLREGKLRMEQV